MLHIMEVIVLVTSLLNLIIAVVNLIAILTNNKNNKEKGYYPKRSHKRYKRKYPKQ
ncbi:hypothetical protein [Oceanobacillus kimchii]|uniref:Uncharacterized protein n=1 Tax=Oceanobacillus kimchii TaxID=746691 RepID=A0ABQ5TM25_9BACI|nr:hypothetical protein [Oceanobacillus kimchii]GLO66160.1 hypothetical protein MACH08_19440 [Oceanobacillus kimchii]